MIAAHIQHPRRSKRNDETSSFSRPRTGARTVGYRGLKKKRVRSGGGPSFRGGTTFKAVVCGGLETKPGASRSRTPLAPLKVGLVGDGDRAGRSRDSSVSGAEALTDTPMKLAGDKAVAMRSRSDSLEGGIRQLEALVHVFKGGVRSLAKEFNELKEEIDQVLMDFEALEDDHMAALASLEEEKGAVNDWIVKLKSCEAELIEVYRVLPEDAKLKLPDFSQATPSTRGVGDHQLVPDI
ncbi:hypothetical protein NMY22_g11783 [Coprinellus aureogranulatus]|nr:hypothetical protein NMY22_g11783 [Coprinellus aureogranulatus]